MPGPSTLNGSNPNTATKIRLNFRFHLIHNQLKTNFLVFWSIPPPRFTTSCAAVSTSRPCSTEPSAASVRATAPRSRTNSEPSPIKTNISSFWNPKDARPMNIISTVFHRRCLGKCNGKRCIRFRDSKICTSIAPDTPSNTTIFRPRNCTIPSKPSWFRDSISPDRSTERPVTKKPQLRG